MTNVHETKAKAPFSWNEENTALAVNMYLEAKEEHGVEYSNGAATKEIVALIGAKSPRSVVSKLSTEKRDGKKVYTSLADAGITRKKATKGDGKKAPTKPEIVDKICDLLGIGYEENEGLARAKASILENVLEAVRELVGEIEGDIEDDELGEQEENEQ